MALPQIYQPCHASGFGTAGDRGAAAGTRFAHASRAPSYP